jgi:SAM-dependent methyltransferase
VKRTAAAALRNADAIVAVLRAVLPPAGRVLELGSGTGEHAVRFATAFPALTWQPSDPDPEARASIAAWSAEARLPNLGPALGYDLRVPMWQAQPADAVLCVNVLHAAPPECMDLLARGAAAVLPAGGALVVYGPFWSRAARSAPLPQTLSPRAIALVRSGAGREGDEARRLTRIDGKLRAYDPGLGVRDRDAFVATCAAHGLALAESHAMLPPDDGDLLLVFRRA